MKEYERYGYDIYEQKIWYGSFRGDPGYESYSFRKGIIDFL